MPLAVSHDDRLTVVDHLDELRSRIVKCLVAIGVAFGVAFWQDQRIFDLVNEPLGELKPVTLSPVEPFLTTITLSLYAAILIALPFVLYQIYAFVLPAFTPTERQVALPLLLMVPFLFIAGVVFSYLLVLPKSIDFLLAFNDEQFNTQLRARDYYSFVSLLLISMGLLFQVPVGILAATKLGITTPEKLRKGRRYAILAMAILAALLPTIDPVTMLLEMIPLVLLYEVSILLASAFGKPKLEDSGEAPEATEDS